jgi:AraC-like DNA-binding protein
MASIRMIIRSTYLLGLQEQIDDFVGPYKSLLLYSLPLFFLYFKAIIFDYRTFQRKDLCHLIFPASLLVFNLFFYKSNYIKPEYLLFINAALCTFYALFYVVKSYLLLKKELWGKQREIHFTHYKLIRNWTIFLFTICVILTLRLIGSIFYETLTSNELSGKPLTILQVTLWLVIFIKILISPEILYGMPKLEKQTINSSTDEDNHELWHIGEIDILNQQDKKLKEKVDSKIADLIKEIEFLSREKNYFRNQKITITDMANELNIPVSHLIYMFKYHCQYTFTEYKTIIKIEDAKRLIESGFLTVNTLESLAIEVGFSSYNPFFTAFKKLTGKSPNEYAMSLTKK